jgi:hypothetical protein
MLSCTPPRSTRLTADDFQAIGDAMGQSLVKSEAIVSRMPTSEPWVISIAKATNLTSDVMTLSEQWSIIERVRDELPIDELWDLRKIRLVIPPDKRKLITETVDRQTDASLENPAVTHTMSATFYSAPRATRTQRTELYYMQFELVDLRSGEPVWQDRFEFKRAAVGEVWD